MSEYGGKAPLSLKKRAVSHKVPRPSDKRILDRKVNIRDFNEVLSIDEKGRTCIAEPGVTFVDLVRETMKYGLIPIIVPELKTITIGGAVAGCSIESMSFMYGGFHDTCLEYEVITAKGEVLRCTPDNENKLLFQMVHGTFGTLGIISRLKFRLLPAKPFVKVTFERYGNLEDYKKAIWEHYKEQDIDFMDGIIRYDKGVTHTWPRSFIGRLFLRKFFDSNFSLKMADAFKKVLPSRIIPITVDVFIPFSKVGAFLDFYTREVNHYPLWCVPYKRVRHYEWISEELAKSNRDELFIDLAVYGIKNRGGKNYYRLLEEELMKIGGIKTLISGNYYSEEEFWRIWNRENYEKVKRVTDPDDIFRDLYTKTCLTTRGLGR